MVISAELHAQILRYHHVEKWRAGTIARQIGVHRDVVARVLAQSGLPAHGPMQRPMRNDPYLPFILKTLETFPTLTAARLYAMVLVRRAGRRSALSRRGAEACARRSPWKRRAAPAFRITRSPCRPP